MREKETRDSEKAARFPAGLIVYVNEWAEGKISGEVV